MKKNILEYLKKVIGRINPMSFAALICFILLSLTVAAATSPLDGEKELYNGIIRFHVLANSDSEEDQNLKLRVRDKVTMYTTEILSDCKSINEAKKIITDNKKEIEKIAENAISEQGFTYSVSLTEGFEIYPRRTYGKYTFPAGRYYSVRLEIGKAEGKNWWCVLFPPMCLGGAAVEKYDNAAELSEIGFSENEISIISEEKSAKKEIRFFFLDIFNFTK